MIHDYNKDHAALKGYLLGCNYHGALRSMEFAGKYHQGTRRNGDREFSHQIGIVRIIRSLPDLQKTEEKLIITALLHDVPEDYAVPITEIQNDFGSFIAKLVEILTKRKGQSPSSYYSKFKGSPRAALVKGADRIHNLSTAKGAFTEEKLLDYLEETREYVIPTLRNAQRDWPKYFRAFDAERLMIEMLMGALAPAVEAVELEGGCEHCRNRTSHRITTSGSGGGASHMCCSDHLPCPFLIRECES